MMKNNNNMYLIVLNNGIHQYPNSNNQHQLISAPLTYNLFTLQNHQTNHNQINMNQSNINVINYHNYHSPTNQHLPNLGNISSTMTLQQNNNNNNSNNNNNIHDYISHNHSNQLGNIPITTATFDPFHNKSDSVQSIPIRVTNEQLPTLAVTTNNNYNSFKDSDKDKANNINDTKTTNNGIIFECNYCNKRFTKKWNLKEHIKVHTKEKPFRCNICLKGFSQKHSLKDHLRIHSGEKPFQCDICYKRFRIKYNMKVHRRIHTGEKPYSCKLCKDRSFVSKAGLNSHLTTHIK